MLKKNKEARNHLPGLAETGSTRPAQLASATGGPGAQVFGRPSSADERGPVRDGALAAQQRQPAGPSGGYGGPTRGTGADGPGG